MERVKYFIYRDRATGLWALWHVHATEAFGTPKLGFTGSHNDFRTNNWRKAMWVATGDDYYATINADGDYRHGYNLIQAPCGARTLVPKGGVSSLAAVAAVYGRTRPTSEVVRRFAERSTAASFALTRDTEDVVQRTRLTDGLQPDRHG